MQQQEVMDSRAGKLPSLSLVAFSISNAASSTSSNFFGVGEEGGTKTNHATVM